MKIGSICRRRVVTIDAASSLTQAAALMREHHVGALVVTSASAEGTHVRGIVTDRDLVIHVLARGSETAGVRVGELTGAAPFSVHEEDSLSDAIAAMKSHGVRRLLVTNSGERLCGILSLDDVVSACGDLIEGLAGVIRAGAEREVAAELPPAPPLPPTLLRIPAMGTAGWRPQGAVRPAEPK